MFNETLSAVAGVTATSLDYLKTDFLGRIFEIFNAPSDTPKMLWMLLPLLATAILLEFYFGRYKEEELGWNTAYGNALVLAFVSIDLFRHIYEPLGLSVVDAVAGNHPKIIISIAIFALALLLILIDFFHFLPKKVAYAISSPTYINFLSILGIIIVYSSIPLDWTTLFACIVILGLLTLVSQIIYWIVPDYTPPIHRILTVEDIEKIQKKK